MRSENKLIGKGMDLLNPVVSRSVPNINRKTARDIQDAGFEIIEELHLFISVFRLILAQPQTK
jgi:hypothetical protein